MQPIDHEYEELKNVQDALLFKTKMKNLTWDEAEEELRQEGYHAPVIRRVVEDAKREKSQGGKQRRCHRHSVLSVGGDCPYSFWRRPNLLGRNGVRRFSSLSWDGTMSHTAMHSVGM